MSERSHSLTATQSHTAQAYHSNFAARDRQLALLAGHTHKPLGGGALGLQLVALLLVCSPVQHAVVAG